MFNNQFNHGFENRELIKTNFTWNDFTLDFEPDDDDLNSGDETDQTTLLD